MLGGLLMSEKPLHGDGSKPERSFPLIIAITALVLAVTSGVVNYRQNNLSGLESSLRDTRDQLQLAKNDITDIRMKTVQQLVDAEFAIKNQQQLKDDNARLKESLAESARRIGELEEQIKRMDHQLVRAKSRLKSVRKKPAAKKTAAKNNAARHISANHTTVLNASADLDIYTSKIAPSLQGKIGKLIASRGFKPEFPPQSASMQMTNSTTIFYYDIKYKGVAEDLMKAVSEITPGKVLIRKGASPYSANKIIAHIIGN